MAEQSLEKVLRIIIQTADPDRIILFGSRAKGQAKPDSDYDLCVLKHGLTQRRPLVRELYRSLLGVGVPVEVIVETPERFEQHKENPYLIYHEIDRDGQVVYEK